MPVPDECLQLVMTQCVRLLHTVISPTENDADLPVYADTVAEWKDFCGAAKSTCKFVLSEAAAGAPDVALRVVLQVAQSGAPQIQAVASGASDAVVNAAVVQLDVRRPEQQ